jgi:hypothetical protein
MREGLHCVQSDCFYTKNRRLHEAIEMEEKFGPSPLWLSNVLEGRLGSLVVLLTISSFAVIFESLNVITNV